MNILLASSFINNIVNKLIRSLPRGAQVTISIVFICVAIWSLYNFIVKSKKDKPAKIGWLILMILSMLISIAYMIL